MKRTGIIIGLVLVLVIGVGGWWVYTNVFAPAETTDAGAEDADEAVDELENVIWASGRLEPVTWAALSPATTGLVSRIEVAEGDWVEAGTLLLELENETAAAQVQEAEAAVAEAEAALAKLRAGATAADVASAEADLAAAKAQVAVAAGQMIECEAAIEQAEAQVRIANNEYAELASHPTPAELAAVDGEVAVAEAAMNQAQTAYNLVRGDPQIASRPEAITLYQTTAAWEAANAKAEITRQGATAQELAVANSRIAAAEAQVEMTRSKAVGAQAAVEAAMAAQAGAQARLDKLRAGATAEEIAMAEAQVLAARAALEVAQANLRQSQVIAPFAGQVGNLPVRTGEMATPGQPAVLLGDAEIMHVVTTDLRETDVVRLHPDMAVEVTFDALPGHVFDGTITKIAPVSNTERGSTNYTVEIDVDDLDPDLRWGMTAFVNINAPP